MRRRRRGVATVLAALIILIALFTAVGVYVNSLSKSYSEYNSGYRVFSKERSNVANTDLRLSITGVYQRYVTVNLTNIGNRIIWLYPIRRTGLKYFDYYFVRSTTSSSTTSSSFVDDSHARIEFSIRETLVALIIYSGSNTYRSAEYYYGKTLGINVDGKVIATASQSPVYSNYPNEVTVMAMSVLTPGSHTIKGVFHSNYNGQRVTINERQLSIVLFRAQYGDYYYGRSTNLVSTTSTAWTLDSEAYFNFTLQYRCLAVVLYNAGNFHGQSEYYWGTRYGIYVDSDVVAENDQSPYGSGYANSGTVIWSGILDRGNHTVRGVFASNRGGYTVSIGERQFIILLFRDDQLHDFIRSTSYAYTYSTRLVDDPHAVITRSLSDSKDTLILYSATNYDGSYESYYGTIVGINVDGNDYSRSQQSPYYYGYKCSASAVYMATLNSGSHTIKGRFATPRRWYLPAWIDERQLLVLYFRRSPRENSISDIILSYYDSSGYWRSYLILNYSIMEVGVAGSSITFNPATHTWLNPGEYTVLYIPTPSSAPDIDTSKTVDVVFIAYNGGRVEAVR